MQVPVLAVPRGAAAYPQYLTPTPPPPPPPPPPLLAASQGPGGGTLPFAARVVADAAPAETWRTSPHPRRSPQPDGRPPPSSPVAAVLSVSSAAATGGSVAATAPPRRADQPLDGAVFAAPSPQTPAPPPTSTTPPHDPPVLEAAVPPPPEAPPAAAPRPDATPDQLPCAAVTDVAAVSGAGPRVGQTWEQRVEDALARLRQRLDLSVPSLGQMSPFGVPVWAIGGEAGEKESRRNNKARPPPPPPGPPPPPAASKEKPSAERRALLEDIASRRWQLRKVSGGEPPPRLQLQPPQPERQDTEQSSLSRIALEAEELLPRDPSPPPLPHRRRRRRSTSLSPPVSPPPAPPTPAALSPPASPAPALPQAARRQPPPDSSTEGSSVAELGDWTRGIVGPGGRALPEDLFVGSPRAHDPQRRLSAPPVLLERRWPVERKAQKTSPKGVLKCREHRLEVVAWCWSEGCHAMLCMQCKARHGASHDVIDIPTGRDQCRALQDRVAELGGSGYLAEQIFSAPEKMRDGFAALRGDDDESQSSDSGSEAERVRTKKKLRLRRRQQQGIESFNGALNGLSRDTESACVYLGGRIDYLRGKVMATKDSWATLQNRVVRESPAAPAADPAGLFGPEVSVLCDEHHRLMGALTSQPSRR
eukprot:TRINITY_DN3699_c0_g1_i2.p1 TRINITY_DN3699_c0_g1~~TRINITY_DN3699_c0_g1_i2.p1  ORF type:complete len:665 (+),score=240.64 TRINITY_DN3699_c0_g1_i2:56-1996(+)